MSSPPSDSNPGGARSTDRFDLMDRQTIALERIADGVESLRDDLRAICAVLQRVAIRGARGEE